MIKGFIRPRLTRLGKIHLGEKAVSKGGKEYPKDLGAAFRVPPEVAEVYGERPTELDVMVPSVNIEEWFPFSLKRYSAGEKLCCRGDGETAHEFRDDTGEWVEIECGYQECDHYGSKKCAEIGTLMVILPKVNLSGVYQIDTGSWHGINNVYGEFDTFKKILSAITGEPRTILGVTFKLTREAQTLQVYDEQQKKRLGREKYLLHLRAPSIDIDTAHELARRYRGTGAPMLTAGSHAPALGPAASDDSDVFDGEYSAEDDVECPVAPAADPIVPEPDESQPKDLYPGASPEGASMGQKSAWAALLEQVQEMGKNPQAAEKSVVTMISRDATGFGDLTADEATDALDKLTHMVECWQGESAAQEAPPQEAAPDPEPPQKTATKPKAKPAAAKRPEKEPVANELAF